jgi:HTH-type transcriptional regulator/antitoxin MqsA
LKSHTEARWWRGSRCDACGEVEFDAESARRYAAAGDARPRTAEQGNPPHRLTGGGHDAFSRYERGEVAPLPAVINLFRLLDKHPDLLKDLM